MRFEALAYKRSPSCDALIYCVPFKNSEALIFRLEAARFNVEENKMREDKGMEKEGASSWARISHNRLRAKAKENKLELPLSLRIPPSSYS